VKLSLRNWGAKHLLIAWGAYWLALAVATLKPALEVLGRLVRADAHGQANAAIGDGLLRLTITSGDGSAWTGAIQFSSLVLWLFGPPLVLWLLWAVSRPRRDLAASERDRAL
jgi:succinate-acetate transporter protein